jgi:opacity protein-like surface antigen
MHMKRILVLSLVVFGVVAFAATAGAQNLLGTLEVNGGYAKSSAGVTTTGDALGGGVTFGAAYWRPISPQVSWGAEISYDNMGTASETEPITSLDLKYSGHAFRVNPGLRLNFGAPVGPSFFAQAGAGLYSVSYKVETSGISADVSQSKVGFNMGAGVGFPVGPKTKLNFSGNYHIVSAVEENGVKASDNSNYLQFRAGVAFGI